MLQHLCLKLRRNPNRKPLLNKKSLRKRRKRLKLLRRKKRKKRLR